MSWRERAWEVKWIEPLLPNYLKPLQDTRIETEHTRELIKEAEEFLTDLSSLSELPRLNKTFKRNIKGFLFKVKIKPKKIHLELIDTKKSTANIRKRIYITIFRKEIKSEQGMGKCIDSTIYYVVNNKTIVRNIRKHPLFQAIFIRLHQLDKSLSGEGFNLEQVEETAVVERQLSSKSEVEKLHINQQIRALLKQYQKLDPLIVTKLEEIEYALEECLKEVDLLDIEEKHHMKRLVNYDLPNLLETYINLNTDQRKKSYNDVIASIHSMRSYIENQSKQLTNSRMDRMNQLIQLNKIRYHSERKGDDYI
ncbi:hypothetical protein ACERII_02710 [Evansella sp. AB-rgal1]|uniref:hypothetical protein n=1 Tax=Evansella sp. AB-rgal1 TaxID=3242696 RepID=UPI00359EFDE1